MAAKAKAPKRKHKMIWIMWDDARIDREDALEAKDIPEHGYLESGGLFIKEDDNRVYFALDFFADMKQYRDVQSVPKCNILEMQIHEF